MSFLKWLFGGGAGWLWRATYEDVSIVFVMFPNIAIFAEGEAQMKAKRKMEWMLFKGKTTTCPYTHKEITIERIL